MDALKNNGTPSFPNAVSLVKVGEVENVEVLLTQQPTLYTLLERVYLQTLIACTHAQAPDLNEDERESSWKEAAEILHAAREALLVVDGAQDFELRPEGTIRRQRPWTLWMLGNLAVSLECPAVEHYARALTLLNERRMNIPWLRIQVLCNQAEALANLHLYESALVQYENALALSQGKTHEAMTAIFIGLCSVHGHLANSTSVFAYGQQALESCSDDATRGEVFALLGHLYHRQGNAPAALTAYGNALLLARDAESTVKIQLELSLLALEEQHIREAQRLFSQASQEVHEPVSAALKARLCYTCGSIAQAIADSMREEDRLSALVEAALNEVDHSVREEEASSSEVEHSSSGDGEHSSAWLLYQEGIFWYRQALAALPGDTEVLRALATLLSHMVEQNNRVTQDAFWQEAYHILKQSY